MTFGYSLLFAVMLATLVVLVAGIVLMTVGGQKNKEYGNSLMRARVFFQAGALLLLAFLFAMGAK